MWRWRRACAVSILFWREGVDSQPRKQITQFFYCTSFEVHLKRDSINITVDLFVDTFFFILFNILSLQPWTRP
jgi:hypothetical protein